jgi:RNA polymerase sigma factor (sigma-70 family)
LKEFPVTITAQMRHGILWEARQKLGSSKALADALGVSQQHVGTLINFRWSPGEKWLARHGEAFELKLSEILGRPVTLAEIFPPELCSESFQRLAKRIERTIQVDPERLIAAGAAPALPPMPEDLTFEDEKATALREQLATLTPRQEKVLRMRFGLDGGEHTLQEIADACGVSAPRARQIEQAGLRRLRHPSRSAKLKPFVEGYVTPELKPLTPPLKPTEKGWRMVGKPTRAHGVVRSPGLGRETFERALIALRNRRIRDNAPSRPQTPFDYLFTGL